MAPLQRSHSTLYTMSVLPPVLAGGLQVSCMLPAVRRGVDLRSSGGVGGPEGVTDCRSEELKAIGTLQTLWSNAE